MNINNIKNNFDKCVNTYEQVGTIQKNSAYELVNYLCACINDLKNIDKIIDVGCGTGFATEALIKYFPKSNYVLNDLSLKMLTKAYNKLNSFIDIKILEGDAENISFEPSNLIISNLAFQWFKNFEDSLNKLYKKTEIIAFTTLMDGTFMNWTNLHNTLDISKNYYIYPTFKEIKNQCLKLSPSKYFFKTKNYELIFNNVSEFLKYIKFLGANIPNSNYTFSDLKKIKSYKSKLIINYNVFFGILIK